MGEGKAQCANPGSYSKDGQIEDTAKNPPGRISVATH